MKSFTFSTIPLILLFTGACRDEEPVLEDDLYVLVSPDPVRLEVGDGARVEISVPDTGGLDGEVRVSGLPKQVRVVDAPGSDKANVPVWSHALGESETVLSMELECDEVVPRTTVRVEVRVWPQYALVAEKDFAVLCERPKLCGNERLDLGEECDGWLLDGKTCADFHLEGDGLACANCVFDTTGCKGACGNDTADPGEDCDGADLRGKTCAALGFPDGTSLSCTPLCTYDLNGCKTSAPHTIPGLRSFIEAQSITANGCQKMVGGTAWLRAWLYPNGQWAGMDSGTGLPSGAPAGSYIGHVDGTWTLDGSTFTLSSCASDYGETLSFTGTWDQTTGELSGTFAKTVWDSTGGKSGLINVVAPSPACVDKDLELFPADTNRCVITECDPARRLLRGCETWNADGVRQNYPAALCYESKPYKCWDVNGNPL